MKSLDMCQAQKLCLNRVMKARYTDYWFAVVYHVPGNMSQIFTNPTEFKLS